MFKVLRVLRDLKDLEHPKLPKFPILFKVSASFPLSVCCLILIIDFSNFDYFQGKKNEATTYFSTATDRSIIGTVMFHF